MKQKWIIVFLLLFFFYVLAYGWFRQTHVEVWEENNRPYIIFPSNSLFLYYFFRPLSYTDSALTGIDNHIGPHPSVRNPQGAVEDDCVPILPTELMQHLEKLYPGYRLATSGDQALITNTSVCNTSVVSEDFDGDRRADYAMYLIRNREEEPLLLGVLSTVQGWRVTEFPYSNDRIAGAYISIAVPGEYEHTEAFDFDGQDPMERERINVATHAIFAGLEGSTAVLYAVLNGEWVYVWVSD